MVFENKQNIPNPMVFNGFPLVSIGFWIWPQQLFHACAGGAGGGAGRLSFPWRFGTPEDCFCSRSALQEITFESRTSEIKYVMITEAMKSGGILLVCKKAIEITSTSGGCSSNSPSHQGKNKTLLFAVLGAKDPPLVGASRCRRSPEKVGFHETLRLGFREIVTASPIEAPPNNKVGVRCLAQSHHKVFSNIKKGNYQSSDAIPNQVSKSCFKNWEQPCESVWPSSTKECACRWWYHSLESIEAPCGLCHALPVLRGVPVARGALEVPAALAPPASKVFDIHMSCIEIFSMSKNFVGRTLGDVCHHNFAWHNSLQSVYHVFTRKSMCLEHVIHLFIHSFIHSLIYL